MEPEKIDPLAEMPPQPAEEPKVEVPPMPEKFLHKEPGKRGGNAEWMAAMAARRKELAKKDPSRVGGRPRKRFTKAEAEEEALRRMMPKALAVLEGQLDSPDERVRQSAAIKVMEYVKGKPTQTVKQTTDQVTRIEYVSAAWHPVDIQTPGEGEVIDQVPLELPPADDAA